MEILVACLKGLEDVCILEINELTKKKAIKISDGRIKVNCTEADIKKLSRYMRSGLRICKFLGEIKFKALKDIIDNAAKFHKDCKSPIAVRCSKQNSNLHSGEVERGIGEVLYNKGLKVNLENPKTTVLIDIINDECFYCILIEKDLNKRDYRIRSTGQSVNATIGYALVRLSGWKKAKKLLDPFSKDGTIVIEAAAFANSLPLKFKKPISSKTQSIFCFDPLLNNVNNSETNAKLAGVNKAISFARYDVEWLSTKFNRDEMDYIVTILPYYSKEARKQGEKLYRNLFNQAEFILAQKGKIAALAQSDIKEFIGKFRIVSERFVFSGGVTYNLLVLEK